MKPNVKDPARRTRYQDDQEYNILFKQYEKHLLHAGEIELKIRSALKETEVNVVKHEEHNSGWYKNIPEYIPCIQMLQVPT